MKDPNKNISKMLKFLIFFHLIIFMKMNAQNQMSKNINFLEDVMRKSGKFEKILENKQQNQVQIIYTQIDRNKKNTPSFTHYFFNPNPRYFYPASTVKFPVSVLALQRLNELKECNINKNTTLYHEKDFSGQTEATEEPTAENKKPSISNYIKQILLVSDNNAFNRLYEFLGHDYINQELQKKGYKDT